MNARFLIMVLAMALMVAPLCAGGADTILPDPGDGDSIAGAGGADTPQTLAIVKKPVVVNLMAGWQTHYGPGSTDTFTAVLRTGNTGLGNKTLRVYKSEFGGPWVFMKTIKTKTGLLVGQATFSDVPDNWGTTNYKVVFPGDSNYYSSVSNLVPATVDEVWMVADSSFFAFGTQQYMKVNRQMNLKGKLMSGKVLLQNKTVYLYTRKVGRTPWSAKVLKTGTVASGTAGWAVSSFKPLSDGDYQAYMYFPGDAEYKSSRTNIVNITATPVVII